MGTNGERFGLFILLLASRKRELWAYQTENRAVDVPKPQKIGLCRHRVAYTSIAISNKRVRASYG